jgi:endonuclease/exonuclease/phosphatase (EEP) superfamily protein YafD
VSLLAAGYALGFVLWRGLLASPLYDHWWQLPLSEVFASWAYLPLALLLALALATRSRVGVVALVAPLIFFAGEYGRQFLPNWPVASADSAEARKLTVLTWNTRNGLDFEDEFLETLDKVQPDLLAMQEVGWGISPNMQNILDDRLPYQEAYRADVSSSLTLFSRYPIIESQTKMDWEQCQCQITRLDWDGEIVTVLNVHIWAPRFRLDSWEGLLHVNRFDIRHQTPIFDSLIAEIRQVEGPLIVMGDFNTTERQRNFRRLLDYLEDAYSEAGWGLGYTWPNPEVLRMLAPFPVIQIDHILVNDAWRSRRTWTGRIAGSDHLYMAADLAYRGVANDR